MSNVARHFFFRRSELQEEENFSTIDDLYFFFSQKLRSGIKTNENIKLYLPFLETRLTLCFRCGGGFFVDNSSPDIHLYIDISNVSLCFASSTTLMNLHLCFSLKKKDCRRDQGKIFTLDRGKNLFHPL